ncbi:MAG: glycosyltransferase family 4 protein [Saprospiraceae bacterium]|nr:glycosyltransferase family 4 protein [Saprospiraceae bacterium]
MKKVLIISNSAWNIYNFRRPILNALLEYQVQISCMAAEDQAASMLIQTMGLKFEKLRFISDRNKNPFKEFLLFFEMFIKIWKQKPSIILSFTTKINVYSGIISRILRIPIIITVSGLGSEYNSRLGYSPLLKFLIKRSYPFSDYLLFHNREDLEELVRNKLATSLRSYVVPGSGIDIDYFKCNRRIKAVKNFLFMGRLIPEKGIKEFIESARKLSLEFPDVRYYIIGNQNKNEHKDIQAALAQVESLKNFKLIEFTPEVKKYYELTDCFVLPSYREGLSKALMEAMSMSRLVIATDVPGCNSLVVPMFNGFLVSPHNEDELYKTMKRILILNEADLNKLTDNSRETIVASYKEKDVAQFYINYVQSIFDLC